MAFQVFAGRLTPALQARDALGRVMGCHGVDHAGYTRHVAHLRQQAIQLLGKHSAREAHHATGHFDLDRARVAHQPAEP